MHSVRYSKYKSMLEGDDSEFFKALMFFKTKVSTGKGVKTDWKDFCNNQLRFSDEQIKEDLGRRALGDAQYQSFGSSWLQENNILLPTAVLKELGDSETDHQRMVKLKNVFAAMNIVVDITTPSLSAQSKACTN